MRSRFTGSLLLALLLHRTSAQSDHPRSAADDHSSHIPIVRTSLDQDQDDASTRCQALSSSTFENVTILNATYYSSPTSTPITPLGSPACAQEIAPTNVSVPLCRVAFVVNTTDTSQVKAEAWLPDEWYGRFLAGGNGGLNGCKFQISR
jgi:feruloyl esterase